jgi:tetratricopeptide (TPR) repeat protein
MVTPSIDSFGDERKLIYRLAKAIRKGEKIAFLLGSAIAFPRNDGPGIPGISGVIKIIRDRFAEDDTTDYFDSEVGPLRDASSYQKAMQLLLHCEGTAALNQVIRKAVLGAYSKPASQSANEEHLEKYEHDAESWVLSPALASLGKLCPVLNVNTILTSNFDPLIEISLRRHSAKATTVVLSDDGGFSGVFAEGCSVVHFHGYWRGQDTLHTVDQIKKPRPKLEGELRRLLADHILVVLGYGAWDDVFTSSLFSVIREGGRDANVLWAFFNSDLPTIVATHSNFFEKIYSGYSTRVIPYVGIDAHKFLPNLHEEIVSVSRKSSGSTSSQPDSCAQDKPFALGWIDPGCDAPPSIDFWCGRSEEIKNVINGDFKVAFVTGMGGQGKSYFAAKVVSLAGASGFELWDWRDCKEEANRLHTNLTRLISRLSRSEVGTAELGQENYESLVHLLFQYLGERRILFVFDNVDEFINLRDNKPERGVGLLVSEALRREHNSRFLFTCRPNISHLGADFKGYSLRGLDSHEAVELFKMQGLRWSESDFEALSRAACKVTGGHPLWLTILSAHCSASGGATSGMLQHIRQLEEGASDEHSEALSNRILTAAWARLNDKQRDLLLAAAECVRPETEGSLELILRKHLSYNAFRKALLKLQQLNLLVIKPDQLGRAQYDLHPLVREFVRTRHGLDKRVAYIALIINFFDEALVKIKARKDKGLTVEDYRNWLYKAELEINKGSIKEAFESLGEADAVSSGYGIEEEFVRVAWLALKAANWIEAFREDFPSFLDVLQSTLECLTHLGRADDATALILKAKATIQPGGAQYIRLTEQACYFYWFIGEFRKAIEWGEDGANMVKSSGADLDSNIEHNLALALRDSRDADAITRALSIFLKGYDLNAVLAGGDSISDRSMIFYGNIGRCLQFLGSHTKAAICFKRSLEAAQSGKDAGTKRNFGYAYSWLGEIEAAQGDTEGSCAFFRFSQNVWQSRSPVRLEEVRSLERKLIPKDVSTRIWSLPESEVREICSSRLKRISE